MVGWKAPAPPDPTSHLKYMRDFYSPIDTCVGPYPASDTERIPAMSHLTEDASIIVGVSCRIID